MSLVPGVHPQSSMILQGGWLEKVFLSVCHPEVNEMK